MERGNIKRRMINERERERDRETKIERRAER